MGCKNGRESNSKGYYLCKVIVMKVEDRVWTEPKILYWKDNVWVVNLKTFKTIQNENVLLWMKVPEEFI